VKSTFSIIHVSDTVFDTNGVSRFIQDMARHARDEGMEYTVLTSSPLAPDELPDNIVNLRPPLSIRMPFYKEQSLTVIPPLLGFYRILKKYKPDVVHISTPGPLGVTALAVAKLMGIQTASTYHTDFPSYMLRNSGSSLVGKITLWVMRLFYRRMSLVVSRSHGYIDILKESLGISAEKILFLRPGTDTQRFHPEHRQTKIWSQYGINESSIKVLYVGRLSVEKNFQMAVDVFKSFCTLYGADADFIVIGEGEAFERKKEYAEYHIHLLGKKAGEELSSLYASSDIFLFPSTTETLGQAVMEALASGLPCIVSDRGGVTENVRDGLNGYTLSVDNASAWIDALRTLSYDIELRARMAVAAFEGIQHRSIQKSFHAFIEAHQFIVKEESCEKKYETCPSTEPSLSAGN